MSEMGHILCPVDFSSHSRDALEYAVALAGRLDSRLTALHVIPPIAPYADLSFAVPFAWAPEDRERFSAELRQFVSEAGGGRPVESLISEGPAAVEILRHIELLGADLVVLGTHGRSGVERLLLGSVAERVLHAATCSVMTIPAKMPVAVPIGAAPFTRILCATDLSEPATHALEYAGRLAVRMQADLIALHAIEPMPDFVTVAMRGVDAAQYQRTVETQAADRLRDGVSPAVRAQINVRDVVRVGRPYEVVIAVAEQERADLIVMGVRGRGAAHLALFGSTTNQVIRRAVCPVLTLRS